MCLENFIRLPFGSEVVIRNYSNTKEAIKLNLQLIKKSDSGVIYRGDISGITGRLYWNRVAVCHCDGFSSTKYHSSDSP
jgi:hypothetical protein